MFERLRFYWKERPLVVILILAAVVRLIAVIFSRGWGMHDDHFLVIEPAQAWVDHIDYNAWLPMFNPTATPSGHSLFYPGIHYLLFSFFEMAGLKDPQLKMYFIRLIHGAYSLLTVYLGYRISEKISSKKVAGMTGLLLALFWFMPFYSVRNLVEMVCIPPLLYATWLIIKQPEGKSRMWVYLWAGFILGLAFSIRFQTLTFVAGFGLALLLLKRWKELLVLSAGYLLSITLVQGGTDFFIWGKPFAEFTEYTRYNMANATAYIVNSWYSYILFILGILTPPVSFFLAYGFIRKWKQQMLLFFPAFIFLCFHILFPNKQERFILPFIPFIIILGMAGWQEFADQSVFWKKHLKILKACWLFFWVVNLIILIPFSTWYTKKARVESMTYLSKYPDIGVLLVEDANHDTPKMPPKFYLHQWPEIQIVNISYTWESYKNTFLNQPKAACPRFVLFFDDENLTQRVNRMKTIMPSLVIETMVEPGFMDKLLQWLNPINANENIYIYRNNDFFRKWE